MRRRPENKMNTLARFSTKPTRTKASNLIHVTVVFLGQDDYHADLPDAADVRQIKVQALHHFGLASDVADRYVLRLQGRNCQADERLASLGGREVLLTLVSAEETGRFGEALFLR